MTIYDLDMEMTWTGVAEDGSEVKGTLKIPEVSHEAIDGLSDYVVRPNPEPWTLLVTAHKMLSSTLT